MSKLSGLKSFSTFITEVTDISQDHEHGNVDAYVVDTNREQLKNFLSSNGVPETITKQYLNKFRRVGIIKNMEVELENRGKGIGKKLFDQVIDQAYDEGAEAIFLIADVGEKNQFDLVRWYQSYGFDKIAKTTNSDYLMILHEE